MDGRGQAVADRPDGRLASGPASAIRKSAAAVGGSPSNSVIPPSIHKLIDRTLTPLRIATSACASSWASSEARKSRPTTMATVQYTAGRSCG